VEEEESPERGESDEKTLSQFILESEKDEKLKQQLIKNSKFFSFLSFLLEQVNRCRYEDGYIYQQVFSCLTCY
jgi:hypothetical protein